jgi:hypothetical protein
MPLLPTPHSLGTTCLSCQGLKLRFDRFLGLVITGFIEVYELVGKTYKLAQFSNGKNNKLSVTDRKCYEQGNPRL